MGSRINSAIPMLEQEHNIRLSRGPRGSFVFEWDDPDKFSIKEITAIIYANRVVNSFANLNLAPVPSPFVISTLRFANATKFRNGDSSGTKGYYRVEQTRESSCEARYGTKLDCNGHRKRQNGQVKLARRNNPMNSRLQISRWFIAGTMLTLLATGPTIADELAGSEWRPTLIGTMLLPENGMLILRFGGNGKLTGHSGCNRFFGTYDISGNRIKFGHMGVTRMACIKSVMELESKFLSAIEGTKTFLRNKIELSLFGAKGNPELRFRQTDWD
jgi:heat shock protein HslJ